jgi:hypothetical protein
MRDRERGEHMERTFPATRYLVLTGSAVLVAASLLTSVRVARANVPCDGGYCPAGYDVCCPDGGCCPTGTVCCLGQC